MTPRELNTVCGESNEINGEKNSFWFYLREKNCLLLIPSEKNCTFKLGVDKKMFHHEGKPQPPPPPHISNGPPQMDIKSCMRYVT